VRKKPKAKYRESLKTSGITSVLPCRKRNATANQDRWCPTMLSHQNRELLALFDELPSSAVVPLKIAAAYKGVSEKTIRRLFTLIEVSPRRGRRAQGRPCR
jgi:hypothetical protein